MPAGAAASGHLRTSSYDLEETLNPCGLVMDFLRSCYSCEMVFREGDQPIPVDWYFVDDNAQAFPGFHSFGSANWVNRQSEAGALGEQPGPRPWRDGSKPINAGTGNTFALQCASNVDPEWWRTGIPSGEESGPYNAEGLPECCVTGPPSNLPCEDCGAVPDVDMALTFSCPGCPDLDATSWLLTFNAFPGNWTANGLQLLPGCAPPNFGALVVSRVLATEPCELLFEGGQLFCDLDFGINTATATCDGGGAFLFCEWSGTIGGGGPCGSVPFVATLTVAP